MNFQDVQQLISHYGYYAVLASAIIEGETILLIAAIGAARGLLDLRLVIVCATVSAIVADNGFFWLGRLQGKLLLRVFPGVRPRLERFDALLARWHTPVIIALRFLYGLRTVAPMAVGMSGMSPLRFALAEALSAVLWASLFSCLGYFLGQRVLPLFTEPGALRAALLPVVAGLALLAAAIWLWRRRQAPAKS